MRKITIVGAGRVGESTAQILAIQESAYEVVLTDIREGAAAGVALDIQESAPLFGFDTRVTGSEDSKAMVDSEIVIITAGLPRKPGMSRTDVLDANLDVVKQIVADIDQYAPNAIVIMVTNPVDVLAYAVWKMTGWSRNRIIGLSGVLDAARMASFIAMESNYSVKDISAMVLGGHGDSMVPMTRFTCINGISIDQLLDQATIDKIVERTRHGGAEILALKKIGSANDSPAAAVATMVGAIRNDRKRILPCVAMLEGEYGQSDTAIGVPVVLGAGGMERIIELDLLEHERNAFNDSAEQVRKDISTIELG